MADEFMKGLALFSTGALGWFFFAGWYRVPDYYIVRQLVVEPPAPNNVFDAIAIFASDVFMWLAILGALTFWVLIPAGRELRRSLEERSA